MFVGVATDRSQKARNQMAMSPVRMAQEPMGTVRINYRRLWDMAVRDRFSDDSYVGPVTALSCPIVFRLFKTSTSEPGPRLAGRPSSSSSRPRLLFAAAPFIMDCCEG